MLGIGIGLAVHGKIPFVVGRSDDCFSVANHQSCVLRDLIRLNKVHPMTSQPCRFVKLTSNNSNSGASFELF